MRPPPLRLSLLVWGLAVAFYLSGFFQRVAPASLADLLMRDFALSAAALGNLSALYYYTYAAVQLPTGVLVSRLGPTRLLLAGCLLAGSGALLFGLAQQAALAGLGRALIGAAHGVAWVSMLALVTHWFPPQRFGTVSGVSLMVGTVGAVLAGPPLRWLADEWGWRATLAGTGAVGLLLALLIWALVRDDPRERGHASFATAAADQPTVPLGQALRELFSSRNVWLLAGVNSGVCGAFLAFTGLWGVPFFVQVHGLDAKAASLITTAMLVVFACGAPIFGALSDRWRNRKRPFAAGAVLVAAGFGVVAAAPQAPLALLVPLLLIGGLGAGSMVLSFAYVKESVAPTLQGAASGVVNAGAMVGTLVQMPAIGLILDAHWDGHMVAGVRQYGVAAFQMGLAFLALWTVAALLLVLATRERPHRSPGPGPASAA